MPSKDKLEALDREAHRLRREGAPGMAFEKLSREGWTPESQRAGNGLEPCPPDCGVCHPELFWGKRRKKK